MTDLQIMESMRLNTNLAEKAIASQELKCRAGDAARTSQRGTDVTVLGPKMTDHRLCNQERTMKTMYQGSEMYTPACVGYATEKELRDILQLEQELTRMTMHMRDDRFKSTRASAKAIPLERLIICVLHCPMRTHEQVLTLLLQHACQNRLPNKSVPILDEIVAILRVLGNLKDTWNYEWLTGAKCVSKVKLHLDQSKRIFSLDNMPSLVAIIRLAIRAEDQYAWFFFMEQYIKLIDLMTVSRDYTEEDIDQLEVYCDRTYTLLVTYCGGQAAVTHYFHYIGAGHLVWMCRAYGNIWR